MTPPTRLGRISAGRLTSGYLVVAGALALVFFVRPGMNPVAWTALGLLSVAATAIGIARNAPRRRAAWYFFGGAQLSLVLGDAAYNLLTQWLHQTSPFPSVADLFYLLTYPLAGMGVYLLIRGHASNRDRASLIDAVTVTTGLGLLAWVYLVVPNYQTEGLTGVQRLISIAYPLGDVLVLAMLARLVGDGGMRYRAMQLLILGAAGLLAADVLYGLARLGGTWQVGGPVDAGWVLFYVAWSCAALDPSMRRLGEFLPRPQNLRMGRLRVALLASVSLIAPGVLLLESMLGLPVHAGTIALFSAALFLLVIARLGGILDVHQQSVQRERNLRASGEALVAAQGLDAIYQVALDGVISLTEVTGVIQAAIYLSDGAGVSCVASSGAPLDASDSAELWRAAAEGGNLNVAGTISVTPLWYDRADRGMLVVDSLSALTAEQHGALSTLAAQVTLAVERARLSDDLKQRQGEERFRGILQSTSDIIVIVNARGEITYGTPSLARNLGRSPDALVGLTLADFLHEDDAPEAVAMFAAYAAGTSHAQAIADWHVRHRDGRYVAFEVLSNNLLADARVGGILLTMRDVSERRALEVELKHQAFHDALTGLPNRPLFQDRAEHALARVSRHDALVGMLMVDVDDFKSVNDRRGHAAGDELLVQIAARLSAVLRAGVTVSRFGGDEFAVLVEDLTDVTQAERFAERVLRAFRDPFTVGGEDLRVSASVGLVVTGGLYESLDMTELMRCADLALYAAKDSGKGRFSLYTRDLSTRLRDRLTQLSDLERAMDADEFILDYQPIVSIGTGSIVGCEALVRWRHPSRGLVPPLEFIELAEETGLIVALGGWILDQACAQLRRWSDAGHPDLRLSVNVSARQLHERGFVADVKSALRRHEVPASALAIELTESIFALNDPAISDQLRVLRAIGVKIAMDDFGTGYSSLAYLQKFQIDVLKVDKSFVDGLGLDDSDGSALVRAIISLAHSLRLEVVAEGIEDAAQRDELGDMGCGLGQGYLFSRPVSPEAFSALLVPSSPLGPRTAAPVGRADRASS